ncbi:unnamed protein product [Allacma fusca]|uniref:Uncharacterized protein n=1 Tax=Allacma fusca TaxID=39272 RepID=A0A8J2KY83_9HEXA|nr:unnamed protein product [Allacma fusca]
MKYQLLIATIVTLVAFVTANKLIIQPDVEPVREQEFGLVEENLAVETLDEIKASPQSRFLFSFINSLLGPKGNLTQIVAGAPNNTASLTFIPLSVFGPALGR